MFSRTTIGLLVCFGLYVGVAQAATNTAPTPARTPVATSAPADENSSDTTTAPQQDDSTPYAAISRANVFHLQDPPKPVEKPNEMLLNLPKINITGFRKREGEPLRALFASVPKDPKESPKYFNLAEGEKEDILELKKIDPNQESVDVIIAGTPTTLTVKSNSFVQPVIAKPGAPGMPPPNINHGLVARPPVVPVPVSAPAAQPAPTPYNGGVIVAGGGQSPVATPVIPVGGNPPATYGNGYPNPVNNVAAQGTQVSTGGENALRSIPTRGIRTPNYTPGAPAPGLPR